MDRELRLLVLMQRQIEQARSLGIDGPRLEYLDEPPELRVRVADVGSVEEAHLLGRPRGYESEEEAGGLLNRLYDQGYVKLTLMNGERGFVEITARGLERIRQRRAYEANLPRRLTMPEVSLLGGLRVGMMNLWRADWEGHVIRVRNRRYSKSPKKRSNIEIDARDATEYLEIDGRLAHVGLPYLPETEQPLPERMKPSQPWRSKDLYGELRAADGIREVHAHIGLTAPFRTTGCLIAVDGVVIGGDAGKTFVT